MSKRIFLLNGLAILAVVCNHSAWWGTIAMFYWTDQYRPVTTPNYDQFASPPYYILVVIAYLAFFSVPAFFFSSGFFIAFAARGNDSNLSWKIIIIRIIYLLIPYLIWSVMCFIGEALQGNTFTLLEYLIGLLRGKAHPAYFFIPLLCQFLLASPLLVPLAKSKPKELLFFAALVQLAAISLLYLISFGVEFGKLDFIIRLMSEWSLTRWVFFFTFGLVAGFHLNPLKQWLNRFNWHLLLAVMILGALTILESEIGYRLTGEVWGGPTRLSGSLYALTFILCFLAFDQISVPASKTLSKFALNSYGIYLLHVNVLEFVARVIRKVIPWVLAYQVTLFTPSLIILGVGIPLLLMSAVNKSPGRRLYRYLFG